MSVVQGENLTERADSAGLGYVETLMAVSRQDYLDLYEKSIDPSHKELLEWEDLYMHQLREHGKEDKAADFMAMRFLLWAKEGIEKNGGDVVRIPAVDGFFRAVNDRMRVHLNGFIADANGLNPDAFEVPAIDWEDQAKYLPYSTESEKRDTVAFMVGRNSVDTKSVTEISCEYIFCGDTSPQPPQICGVNYHFTPAA